MRIAIDLWIWPLATDGPVLDRLGGLLSLDELTRRDRFLRPRDRVQFTGARGRLREILGEYCDIAPGDLRFASTGRGKPVVHNGPAFNLSHAGGYGALAVAPDHRDGALPLGIDIEAHRAVDPDLARLSFSQAERAELASVPPSDWRSAFFRGWTRKEAVIKALGTGLFAALDSFDVTLEAMREARVTRVSGEMPPVAHWQMQHLDVLPTMPGALAVATGGAALGITLREGPESVRAGFRF